MNYQPSEKENQAIHNLKSYIMADEHWGENIYEDDDDPYSEPIISFFSMACREGFVHYLDFLVEQIPEHKTKVINFFLYTAGVRLYIYNECWDSLVSLNKKFPHHTDHHEYLSSIYNYTITKNIKDLAYLEKYIDPKFSQGKQLSENISSIIDKYLLHHALEDELNDKKLIKGHKI